MARTKLRSASRFGARYSTPLKQRVADIEEVQRKAQPCPNCGKVSLIRKSYGVWKCTKCDATIAGGAYAPSTPAGDITHRIVEKGEKIRAEELEKAVGIKTEEPEQGAPKDEKKFNKRKMNEEEAEEEQPANDIEEIG